ncbi:hypothetical protein KSP35_16185 [Aquihabitans sp. G128]|uniref:DUF6308 family protein n=1 Tax=Aquihabitans sp. G128 TaxID=2849779 RepID=UPI001C2325B7|nr:DUF6308 family protein [Aquihabitans sp. G128]QXC59904.1 hypothetical protein KSP35_16185 [Aquihabitans sp. G128]
MLCEIADAAPVSGLESYFTTYSGRGFDRVAMEGPPDRFTAGDLYACALLSAEIEPHTGADLLDREAKRCTGLLQAIPSVVSIRDDQSADALASDGAAAELYGLLRSMKSIGPTRASKLLAVKRPGLVPIRDSFVEEALDARKVSEWWAPMVAAWSTPALGPAVDSLRARAGSAVPPYVTDLRLLDVSVWLSIESTHPLAGASDTEDSSDHAVPLSDTEVPL